MARRSIMCKDQYFDIANANIKLQLSFLLLLIYYPYTIGRKQIGKSRIDCVLRAISGHFSSYPERPLSKFLPQVPPKGEALKHPKYRSNRRKFR